MPLNSQSTFMTFPTNKAKSLSLLKPLSKNYKSKPMKKESITSVSSMKVRKNLSSLQGLTGWSNSGATKESQEAL